jgi:hypothetical protein
VKRFAIFNLRFAICVSLIGVFMAMPLLARSGVPQSSLDVLANYFQDANDRLKKVVLHPPGKTIASQEYRRAWASQQIQQSDYVLAQLKAQSSGWVRGNIPAAMKDGLAKADVQIKQAFGAVPPQMLKKMQPSFALVDVRAVQKISIDTVSDLHRAGDAMVDRANGLLRQTAQEAISESQINKLIAGGLIEGKPVAMQQALAKELKAVAGDTIPINGRNYDTKKYAELVGRTKTREATVTARHDRLEELGVDLVTIVGRISTNFCTAFLGQVFSLSGKSDKYEAYSALPGGGPPFHPNCSKSSAPFIEELASDHQLKTADGVEDAQKLLSMTPAEAQRAFKDLQIKQQIVPRYATTAEKLFG